METGEVEQSGGSIQGQSSEHVVPSLSRPRESVLSHLRRRWRSRGRHSRLRYWLWFRGLPVAAAFMVLYVVNGFVIGWQQAYDVTLAIISPGQTRSPALAWSLSLAGWLVAPGVAGAVAGYVISTGIESRRRAPLDQIFGDDGDDRWGDR